MQVRDSLIAYERQRAWFVACRVDPDEWLARFEKTRDFPAREWAERMVREYNGRLQRRDTAEAGARRGT